MCAQKLTGKIARALAPEVYDERDELREKVADLEAELDGRQLPEVETTVYDRADVVQALRDIDGWRTIDHWHPMNDEYRVPTFDQFKTVTRQMKVDQKRYTLNFYDCVEFTTALRAEWAGEYRINALGAVITTRGTPHAFNVVLTDDGGDLRAMLWEPQDDRVVEPDEGDLYRLRDAIVHV